jgi:hypothetical protein
MEAFLRRRVAKPLLVLCALCATAESLPAAARPEVISGRVVAFSGALLCMNGNGYWSTLIRVQHPKDSSAEFIRVDFSLPCEESPRWFPTEPLVQKFRLIRDKQSDSVLQELMGSEDVTTGKKFDADPSLPIWKCLPGAENEKLPFGQMVQGYRSKDWPLMPVL